jgi:hypothetical protein
MTDDIDHDRDNFIDFNLDKSTLGRRSDKIQAFLDEFIEVLHFFLDDIYGPDKDFIC